MEQLGCPARKTGKGISKTPTVGNKDPSRSKNTGSFPLKVIVIFVPDILAICMKCVLVQQKHTQNKIILYTATTFESTNGVGAGKVSFIQCQVPAAHETNKICKIQRFADRQILEETCSLKFPLS